MKQKILTEKDERLLISYFDGELCYFIDRMKLHFLLRRQSAREFLTSLEAIRHITRNSQIQIPEGVVVDLWARIEQRIENEERAALYLGKRASSERSTPTTEESIIKSLISYIIPLERFAWGAIGAVVGIIVLQVIQYRSPTVDDSFVTVQGTRLHSSPLTQNVSFRSQAIGEGRTSAVQSFEDWDPDLGYSNRSDLTNEFGTFDRPHTALSNSAVEVDWLRSSGRVMMSEYPNEKTTVLWVKRRDPLASSRELLATRKSNPPLIVYNRGDGTPRTIQVANR